MSLSNKELKQKFSEATADKVGASFDKEVFDKAYAKAKRWCVQAYGEADMQAYADESGFDLSVYYDECLENKKGLGTMNQQQYQSNRKK